MRSHGVRTLAAWRLGRGCNHFRVLDVIGYPDDAAVPSNRPDPTFGFENCSLAPGRCGDMLIAFAGSERPFNVALQQRSEWLFGLPLGMLWGERLNAIERKQELEIHRLLGPERAVVVERRDALGNRPSHRS